MWTTRVVLAGLILLSSLLPHGCWLDVYPDELPFTSSGLQAAPDAGADESDGG